MPQFLGDDYLKSRLLMFKTCVVAVAVANDTATDKDKDDKKPEIVVVFHYLLASKKALANFGGVIDRIEASL